nr:MAG TPA: hypothetical protein [Caudoviricetes sp.]
MVILALSLGMITRFGGIRNKKARPKPGCERPLVSNLR